MAILEKAKSWNVKLVEGYIQDNRVRTGYCGNCEANCRIVVSNRNNPNRFLFGCENRKCKHTLIRMDISPETKNQLPIGTTQEIILQNLQV